MIIPERTVACFSAFYKFEILWFIILSISKYFFVFFSRGHSFTAQTRRRTQEKSASKNQFVGRGSEGGKLIPFLFPTPPLPSPPLPLFLRLIVRELFDVYPRWTIEGAKSRKHFASTHATLCATLDSSKMFVRCPTLWAFHVTGFIYRQKSLLAKLGVV